MKDYDAIVLATGATKPRDLNVPGRKLKGIEFAVDYLKENIDFALSFFREEMPSVRVMEPEGTYLLWLDFSSYSLTDRELRDTLIHKGKVVLNPGISFGPQGSQHMRLNLACSKETLEEGLLRIKKAFN